MGLHYELARVENYKELCYYEEPDSDGIVRVSPVTEAIIFGSINIGLNHIDDTTLSEWKFRLFVMGKLFHNCMRGVTFEQIKLHKGLRTNASHIKSRFNWFKWVRECLEGQFMSYEYDQRQERKKE